MASLERLTPEGDAGKFDQLAADAGAPEPDPRSGRLARGPLVIGEPAPEVPPQLAATEPYRPDTIADGGGAYGLTVRAASVRGLAKRYGGSARQDDLCLRLHEPTRTLIVAVADGVSAASRSDLAAALAVRHAAATVARQLDRGGGRPPDWGEVFDQAAWALVEQQRRDSGDPRAGVDETAGSLATTLVLATVTVETEPAGVEVEVAAVGDSPAFVLSAGQFTPVVAQPPRRDGLVGGGVEALPRWSRALQRGHCALEPGGVLLVCTDGVALPLADGRGEVGHTLARELAEPPDTVDFARLLDFSASTYDDDRSLVAVWCPQTQTQTQTQTKTDP